MLENEKSPFRNPLIRVLVALVVLVALGLVGMVIRAALRPSVEDAAATVSFEPQIGYVVSLNIERKPVYCWPVRDRRFRNGEDDEYDIHLFPDGAVCFNGTGRETCTGPGAMAVTPPLLVFDPSPKDQGDVWLRGLGIRSCPGGLIP